MNAEGDVMQAQEALHKLAAEMPVAPIDHQTPTTITACHPSDHQGRARTDGLC
jgi:hypothetical protein